MLACEANHRYGSRIVSASRFPVEISHQRERRCLMALGLCVGLLIMAPALTAVLAAKDIIDLRRGTEAPLLAEPTAAFVVVLFVHAIGFAGAILSLIGYAKARRGRQEAEMNAHPPVDL